jgi:ribonuclease HI
MAKKQKYYVIWAGHQTGIFDSGPRLKKYQGFSTAQCKSFDTKEEAYHASKRNYRASVTPKKTATRTQKSGRSFLVPSISVDAACAGNPGILEYQGVNTATKEILFARGTLSCGNSEFG